MVAVMLDQNVQASDGIFVRFFGRPACTTTVAAALALKTGCPIVPAHCVRRADGRYRMRVRPGGRVAAHGPPRRGHRGAHAAPDVDHRGLGAREPRAVAVAAPAVEDAPSLETPSAQGLEGSAFRRFLQPSAILDPPASTRLRPSRHPSHAHRGCGPLDDADPARILVRAPNWVGDVVLSLPALRDLRRAFPASRIEVLAPSVGGRPLRRRARGRRDRREPRHRGRRGGAARSLRRWRCCCRTPSRARSWSWRAGVPERWGYATDGRGALLTRSCRVPASVRGQQPGVLLSGDARGPGARRGGAARRLARLPRGWAERGRALLGEPGPWIGLNPGAAYGTAKRWPPERFAAAAALSWRAAPAHGSRSSAAAAERPLAEAIAAQLRGAARVLCGETTLAELVGVLRELRLLLTNDSGPMHLAAALGTPLVAVFGSTDWRETRPGLDARAGGARGRPSARPAGCASARSTTAA